MFTNKKLLKKKEMQANIRKDLGLNVDVVKPGAGTTNTGNVSRAFFRNPEKASQITHVNIDLIKNISYMLLAINSGYKINYEEFKHFGHETAKLYVEHYHWYYMPQSLHRLFFHTHQIAEKCPTTIGNSSEEAIETSHKCIVNAIKHHSRQHSYQSVNIDVGYYRLQQTDPLLNDKSRKYKAKPRKKGKCLPEAVLKPLESSLPPCNAMDSNLSECNDEDINEDELILYLPEMNESIDPDENQ